MNIDADENAAPSSLERVIRHLETRVLDCNLSILGRALLISTLEEAHEATVPALLALSPTGFAQLATQRGSEAESEWEHVGTLEVELRRSWLLFQSPVAHLHLDLFHERGPTRPPQAVGRVNVHEMEQIMWPAWIRTFSTPASTDTGLLEAMPDGLSRPCYPCEEPPCRHRFVDVTVSARLLQVAMAVKAGLLFGCAVIASLVLLGMYVAPLVFIFLTIRGIGPGVEFLFLWMFLQSFVLEKVSTWVMNYWIPIPNQP